MSARPLCIAPHRMLRETARPVTAFTRSLQRLARDLVDTMYAHDGIGLAAPQVGEGVALFVASPTQARGGELIVANPVLEAARGRTAMTEGCLSLPEVWGRVTRAARVRLRGQDLAGRPLVLEAEGLLAVVLQHEADHLQGRLFIDRLSWLRRRRLPAQLRGGRAAAVR